LGFEGGEYVIGVILHDKTFNRAARRAAFGPRLDIHTGHCVFSKFASIEPG
jgi:hypothetical protein